MIDIEQYPLEYLHHCGRPAFYISCKPICGELFHHEDGILPDGTTMIPGDAIICYYCGEYISLNHMNVRPRR